MSKLIVVLGATGNQGGSVATTFLQKPEWRVRAVTRNAASSKAESLKSRGAEVVEADMDKPETLVAAFAGAQVVYAVSDPIGTLFAGPEKSSVKPREGQNLLDWATGIETHQFKNAVDAAAQTPTLERFIISTLPNTKKLSSGKYNEVYHFDSKAAAEEYTKEIYPDLWNKTSVYYAGWFLSNIVPGGQTAPTKTEEGVLQFSPGIRLDTVAPAFAAEEDSGPIVEALVKEPTAGKKVIGQREPVTFAEFLDIFTKVTGRKTEYVAWPTDPTQLQFPPFLQQPLAQMIYFWDEFGYYGDDSSVITPKDLKYPPALGTVADYLKKKSWD